MRSVHVEVKIYINEEVNGNVHVFITIKEHRQAAFTHFKQPVVQSLSMKYIQQSLSFFPIAHRSLYYKYINHNVSTKAKFNFLLSTVIWAGWYMAGCGQVIYYTCWMDNGRESLLYPALLELWMRYWNLWQSKSLYICNRYTALYYFMPEQN